jgi:outer membrane protein OmpA-like peptidoglycan-associated protein
MVMRKAPNTSNSPMSSLSPQASPERPRSRRAPFAAVAFVVAGAMGACATPPKPPELVSFEKLRREPNTEQAAKRSPDLATAADRLLANAIDHWQSKDLDECRNDSLLGQIKLKHALAVFDQDRSKKRASAADAETQAAEDEFGRLQKDLTSLNEQVALLTRLNETSAALSAEQQRMNTEKLRGTASDRIAEAELAIKTADTVNAGNYAKVPYAAAVDNLTRAKTELTQQNYPAATTSAEMAKAKAAEASAAAKPTYDKEAAAEETKARAEALARDAAAIPNVVVRREARGSLQRLVIPLQAERLFNKRDTTVAPGRDFTLEPIAALMNKYPAFPVQVVGYTDNRGRADGLLALSLARAQSVYTALITRGVDAKRMVVSGQGSAEPITDNRTPGGRAQNNRIEIVFLYQ